MITPAHVLQQTGWDNTEALECAREGIQKMVFS